MSDTATLPDPGRVTALVLAGSRGPGDPVALAAGVSHKAMAPVAGIPMLVRVVRTLLAVPFVGRIAVAIEDAGVVRAEPELAALADSGRLELLPTAPSPARTVGEALERLGTPLLVTTGDHPLLRPDWVSHFWTHLPPDADVAVGLARSETVLAAVPETQRTWIRFSDAAYSGCNLFAFRTPASARVAELWRTVETERKNPLKLIGLLGPVAVARFALGRLSSTAALARLERMSGVRGAFVEMPWGEAAVDVDKAADLVLAERLLRAA
ncbi:nucleotidyltransferase family protein [Rhodospirillum centenum]|uniref:MobA-like NTP transferase domain-containing protein n=1 Tax=Rhodospirillum centenum (strain ATCC 51521 / SW) TaxID=414684 RepID=B6IRV5_RHOCS|nr:NTP transferase domain-containing protein [Rhodospirillum centenum]ACI98191.1 conserved hypothetical protein [Rhodospirillum centenum SW]